MAQQHNGAAAVLSFLIPGLGQIYKGQILNGICWLVVVIFGYSMLIVPGVILHIICIMGASKSR
jgi:TM2 domain-containing membrane protein YozV